MTRSARVLAVKNGIPRPQAFDIEVQFLDSRGLVVDTDRVYRQAVGAQDEVTLRGDTLITLPAALNVVSAHAVTTRRER